MPLKVAISGHDDPRCAIVELAGALDATTSKPVHDRLLQLIAEGRDRIVADVTGLAFCDSGGIWALLDVHRRAAASGGWLRLAGVNGFLLRLLTLTRLKAAFTIDADVPAALAAAGRGPGPRQAPASGP